MPETVNRLTRAMARIFAWFADRGWGHWIIVVIILALSSAASPLIYEEFNLDRARYWLFQTLIEFSPRPIEPARVSVVLIGDDEFWLGELSGRRPVKRSYLAKIVQALDSESVNASVIALDFDLRLPKPNATGAPSHFDEMQADYLPETNELIDAIRTAAVRRSIVLAKSIWWDGEGGYKLEPDVYQLYGLCLGLDEHSRWQNPGTSERPLSPRAQQNISCGYIALPFDMQLFPGRLPVAGGKHLDSFALAVARASQPALPPEVGANISYGSYIRQSKLDEHTVIVAAKDLIARKPEVIERLGHQAVIVGGHWSGLGYGRGRHVDTHSTPVGPLVGAVIHENFAEAFLDKRVYLAIPQWAVHALEITFGLAAAIVFAYFPHLGAGAVALAVLSGVLVGVQWSMVQMFGVFFDAFVPLVSLWLHTFLERVLD